MADTPREPRTDASLPARGRDGPTTVDPLPPYVIERTPRMTRRLDEPTTVDPPSARPLERTPKMAPAAGAPAVQLDATRPVQRHAEAGPVLPKVCGRCGMRYPPAFNVCPRDGTKLERAAAPEDELIGSLLADTYAITRVIGSGGMGRVYEARHMRVGGKRFAVKLLHAAFARSPEALARFQREAEAVASIQSPHVADVYDIGRTDEGRPFIVAELLEGRELAALLKDRGRLEISLAIELVRQLCVALGAAHEQGVVHRDVKPENVFLVGDPNKPVAKVIDFGLSKVREIGGSALTKTGEVMGTPSYMAPEQARGEPVDHRVDVYAAGAILYELVTGRRAFDRGDLMATLAAVMIEEPVRPRALNPAVSPALEDIILRAMAKDPAARFRVIGDLEAALAAQVRQDAPPVAPGSRAEVMKLGALGTLALWGALARVVSAIVSIDRGGTASSRPKGADALFVAIGLGLMIGAPLGLSIAYVKKNLWNDSVKISALADKLRWAVMSGLIVYGALALVVGLVEPMTRTSGSAASPLWDVVLPLAALGVAVVAVFSGDRLRALIS